MNEGQLMQRLAAIHDAGAYVGLSSHGSLHDDKWECEIVCTGGAGSAIITNGLTWEAAVVAALARFDAARVDAAFLSLQLPPVSQATEDER